MVVTVRRVILEYRAFTCGLRALPYLDFVTRIFPRRGTAWLIAALTSAASLRAQCPDGSPPPCRAAVVASAATPRRVNPPLDDRTWIVVPFDNLNGSQDIDWLRGASVNLLYLGLSRWNDLRVIDDERVADYMREVPGAAEGKAMSLNTALSVAKRAGAGKLVMGDILKLGARTTVNAKIFDVKSGQRLRTVREETSVADSLMPMFGKLSQKVLNIAPPPGSNAGVVGTSSMAAYQEYAEGMQALNRFELDGAQKHFARALEIDSTFALAHSKLAVLLGWVSPGQPQIRLHAEAAARLSGSLPPREKALIEASVAFSHQDYVKACEGFRGLIRRDSSDTDAWYGLGDCLYHDLALEQVPGDSARVRWRADRTSSVRAFRRVLELDPTYHLAYQHIVDAYLQPAINNRFCLGQNCATYVTIVRVSGDSLLTVPVQLPRDSALYRAQMEDLLRRSLRRAALDSALRVTETWLAANPTEQRAMMMQAATYLSLGRVAESAQLLQRSQADTSNTGANSHLARVEVAIKLWQGDRALALYDSLRAHPFTLRGGANAITIGNVLAAVAPVFGRMALFDSVVVVNSRTTPLRNALNADLLRGLAGIPVSDTLGTLFTKVYSEAIAGGTSGAVLTRNMAQHMIFAPLSYPPSQWPRFDTTVTDARVAPVLALQRGDTAALRRAAKRLDSLSNSFAAAVVPDTGAALIAAGAYLILRDSASALAMTRRWLDTIFPFTPLLVGGNSNNAQTMMPRAIAMRADLAAALGFRDEARLWYGRLLALWAKADPDAQPVVERVKKAYAALAGT